MHNNIYNERHKRFRSLLLYIISGYIIVILYLFLCRYEFFPLHFCFNWINSTTFNWDAYYATIKYYLFVYSMYVIILFIRLELRNSNSKSFQKRQNACSRFMKYYQVLLIPCSALVLLYHYISDPSIFAEIDHRFDYEITCQSFCYNTVWNIFSSSVIAGLFILPSLLIYFKINKWYTKSRSKKIKLQHCSEHNAKTKLKKTDNRNYYILPKKNMALQFIYWYSILTLWSIFILSIFFIFIALLSFSWNGGGGKYGFCLFTSSDIGCKITIILGYFVFGIILRKIFEITIIAIKCMYNYFVSLRQKTP